MTLYVSVQDTVRVVDRIPRVRITRTRLDVNPTPYLVYIAQKMSTSFFGLSPPVTSSRLLSGLPLQVAFS